MKTPFLGSAYTARSNRLAAQQCINLYPESVDTKEGKEVGGFFMTPGLDLIATAGSGPHRGFSVLSGTLYTVSGNTVYSVSSSGVVTSLGTILTSAGPVSVINNGTQLALFDGSKGYLVAGGVLSALSLPFSGPVSAAFQDGFGVVNVSGTNQWFQSNLNDLSVWQSLNFGAANAKPDNIIAIGNLHREMWLLKQTNSEIWIDAGTTGFAFQRLDGVFPEVGCIASFSVAKAGESLVWLAQNDQGQGVVVKSEGYQPRRISTHAIEHAINEYSTISDAIAYVYQQEGHVFYVLTFPTGNATWVYDLSTGLWHQRAALLNGVLNRHWGNCFAFFNGKPTIGDYLTGNIYAFNLDTLTDNGTQRKWLRSWRALPKPSTVPMQFPALAIDMQTGIGAPAGTDPQVMLRWSDDDGQTWSNYRIADAGAPGTTKQRVKFNRLGSTRRNGGLDRIFELSSTDQFSVSLLGAEILQ